MAGDAEELSKGGDVADSRGPCSRPVDSSWLSLDSSRGGSADASALGERLWCLVIGNVSRTSNKS